MFDNTIGSGVKQDKLTFSTTATWGGDAMKDAIAINIIAADTPIQAVKQMPPIGTRFDGITGYVLSRYDVEQVPRSFWQWITGKPAMWKVTTTFERAERKS